MTLSFHRIPVGICNCYLLRGERTILIDGGAQGSVQAFMHGIKRLRLHPKEISLILLAHGHWDHIGSLHPIQQLRTYASSTFSNVDDPVFIANRVNRMNFPILPSPLALLPMGEG